MEINDKSSNEAIRFLFFLFYCHVCLNQRPFVCLFVYFMLHYYQRCTAIVSGLISHAVGGGVSRPSGHQELINRTGWEQVVRGNSMFITIC